MIIRPYTEKDFEGIVKVVQATQVTDCWPEVFPEGWDEARIRNEFDPLRRYSSSLFLVSEQEGEITGLVAGHDILPFLKEEIPHLREKVADKVASWYNAYYQRDLIISPQWQRGTLGLRLFKEIVTFSLKKGHLTLVTRTPPQNKRGIRFFKGVGYREVFRDDNPNRIYFAKDLLE